MLANLLPRAVLLPVSMALLLCGCGQTRLVGSGKIVTKSPEIDGFSKIDGSWSFKIKVVAGAEFKVEVRADDNVMPSLEIKKSGDTLQLGIEGGNYRLVNVTLEADITRPTLTGIELSGASAASISGFGSVEPFAAALSGVHTTLRR